MNDIGPYSNYRLTVRLELTNKPGMFAKVASTLAEEGANLGAVDLASATADRMVRDVTFDVRDEAHGERVLAKLNAIPDVTVLSASDRVFLLHLGGKIQVRSKLPVTTRNVLSMVYTPGVGRVAQAIAQDKSKAFAFTTKSNSVAVITDGSAVLGLGNLGAEAALPVMEGKAESTPGPSVWAPRTRTRSYAPWRRLHPGSVRSILRTSARRAVLTLNVA
jgi:malate dehydrogenase (oxaloacetate-decarboxylating)